MKQPILVLLGRNNRNQNNNEASNLFQATVQPFKQPKTSQQQREGPARPVTLFTHPVRQQPAQQPGSVLTPGTLLKMSGGNSNKKLTILSPNTVDSVFASDEGHKPKQGFARPSFPKGAAGEITEIEIPPRSGVASDKFSPSCFLRSPHFTTKAPPSGSKKESLTSPMDHQAADPEENLQQVDLGSVMTTNSAGGYGVGSYHQGSLQHNLNQSASFHSQPSDQSGSGEMSEELSDWLDMSNVLPPCEMEALQKELELGSPMNVDPFQM